MIFKNDQHYAYDIEYSHIMNEIITPVVIYSSHTAPEGKCFKANAAWDTGATHSVITPEIVKQLGLISIDKKVVGGIGQEVESDVVVGTIILPNDTVLSERRFLVNVIPDADVIIGMDIISKGDFNISNAKGKTLFSFVIPPYKNKISYPKLISNEND